MNIDLYLRGIVKKKRFFLLLSKQSSFILIITNFSLTIFLREGYIGDLTLRVISEKMNPAKISGKYNKHKVLLYALSTCGWCKLTKSFLKDSNVEYEYVDVDLCNQSDREKIRKHILKRGGEIAYPAIIVDDRIIINGFRKENIKEALEI